jgi:hypothetical protein
MGVNVQSWGGIGIQQSLQINLQAEFEIMKNRIITSNLIPTVLLNGAVPPNDTQINRYKSGRIVDGFKPRLSGAKPECLTLHQLKQFM